jgi:hypothetical protein
VGQVRSTIDVDAEGLKNEIMDLLKEAGESRYACKNINKLLSVLESEIITIQKDQRRVSEFARKKNQKGLLGSFLFFLFIIVIIIILILVAIVR